MNALAPMTLMLHHEVRLNWRMLTARVSETRMLVSMAVLLAIVHLFALALPFGLPQWGAGQQPEILFAVTTATLVGFFIMLPLALLGTVKLIYSRADMDLLLSSPVPPQAIVVVRVLAIALGVFASLAFFLLPAANVMAAFGYPRFLVAYVTLACVALTATSIGVLLAQGVFSLLGARHTRLFAQILAAVLGVGFLLIVNLHNILPDATYRSLMQLLGDVSVQLPGADSLVWLPARAAVGEPLPFLVMVVLSVGLFALTTFGLANRLMANAIAANGVASVTVRSTGGSRALSANRGRVALMRSKEWLLIRRDPGLMTQIAKQAMMFLPSVLIVWKMGGSAYAWLVVVMLAGNLAGSLAWLTVSTEEAPDLLAMAPVRRREVLTAKLQAALIPVAFIMALPLAAAWMLGAWTGMTILLCSAGAAFFIALYHVRHPNQGKRSDLAWRGGSKQMQGVFELLIGLVFAVLGLLLLLFGWWGVLGLPFAAAAIAALMR